MADNGTSSRGASAAAIRRHYDVGNDFYALWLDPTLTYSCAMWAEPGEGLEAAQLRKLDFMAGLVTQTGSRRILDIGCGWGAMLKRLREAHGVERAVGLTLSTEQRDYVEGLGLDGVEARLEDWRHHRPDTPYDGIVSIGAFEHFVKWGASRDEKLAAYREFFLACHRLLPPGAPLVLQSIVYGSEPDVPEGSAFFSEVFPESDCPRIVEILEAAEGLFELRMLRNDRTDYVRTLNAWLRNLRANEERAVALVGRETVDFYKKYLALSSVSFHSRNRLLARGAFERLNRSE